MDKTKAYLELNRLVEKYIKHGNDKEEILKILRKKEYMPPVRGIVDDILKHTNQISKEDMEIIDDLMFYFG